MSLYRFLMAAAIVQSVGLPAAVAQDADVGQTLYEQYCATCHGLDGKGAGPLTDLMSVRPSDLTQLAKNNDGEFPMLDVVHIIDGRTGVRAHGGPMPTYGSIFMDDAEHGVIGDYSPVLITRGRAMSLALYLEGLQE